jgi:hypothetical protein
MAGRGNSNGMNGGPNANRPQDGPGGNGGADTAELSPEEVDASRTREITAKAVTGILILILKWLKLSRTPVSPAAYSWIFVLILLPDVLKFEYMTQLLLDSNYLPLVLKFFAHQDIQQVVDSKTDRIENRYVDIACWCFILDFC